MVEGSLQPQLSQGQRELCLSAAPGLLPQGSCPWCSSFALPLEGGPWRPPVPSQDQCTHHPAAPCPGHSSARGQLPAAARPGLRRTSPGWRARCPRSPGCRRSYATGCRPLPGWCSSPGGEHRVRQEGERMGSASWGRRDTQTCCCSI